MVYVVSFDNLKNYQKDDAYHFCKMQIAILVANKIFIFVFTKYFDFINAFFSELALKLFKYTEINNLTNKLINEQ